MKYSTDLIMRLARGLKTAQLDGLESQVRIPGALNPVVVLGGPQARHSGFSSSVIQRESFLTESNASRANQATVTVVLCTFGSGLWYLNIAHALAGSWQQPYDQTTFTRVRLVDPESVALAVTRLFIVPNVPQRIERSLLVHFAEDGWSIDHNVAGNGVGQTHESNVNILAVRLS